MEVRFARHTERLPEIVRFYRDGLGLPEVGSFEGHAGFGDAETVDAMCKHVSVKPVEPANPYWRSRAVTLADPDGFGVVLVPGSAPA